MAGVRSTGPTSRVFMLVEAISRNLTGAFSGGPHRSRVMVSKQALVIQNSNFAVTRQWAQSSPGSGR